MANWRDAITGVFNGNFVLEGYPTGRNVLRSFALRIAPGGTPGTNITVTGISSGRSFNAPSISDGTNIAKSGSSGSFALSADGLTITMDITEDVIGIISSSFKRQNINNSSTTVVYTLVVAFTGANVTISFNPIGSNSIVDMLTVMQAADIADIYISLVTST